VLGDRDRLSSNIALRDSLCWRRTSYNFRLAMLIAVGPSKGSRALDHHEQ
jgi:hypothetical protein